MKKFEAPAIEVVELNISDVITASICTTEGVNCPDDMGLV